MKKSISSINLIILALVFLAACSSKKNETADESNTHSETVEETEAFPASEALGWRLGAQAYTFNRFTFEEALDKISAAKLKYVEAYPGQKIGAGFEGDTGFKMDAETRDKVKELIESKGLKLVNYGVTGGKDEAEWRALMDFARYMGIETITSEPKFDQLEMIDKLANEYGVNVALHNHPEPSIYYHPDTVLKALEGRSSRMGACADIGHWVRSGLDPVECLQKLEGKIISFHFKDLNKEARDANDVPWGQGVCNVEGVLKEMKRQGFEGVFSVEYEHNWDNNLPEVIESVQYFEKVAASL